MKVHNIMEEYVTARIQLLYNQLNTSKPAWLTCDCEDCRSDAISYVLNRIAPRYIVSGRGVSHNSEMMQDSQLRADVDALGIEAVHLINSIQRPYHIGNKQNKNIDSHKITAPSFNFPVFIGTIFDGTTFEPLANTTVTLKTDAGIVEMIDHTWSNPCGTYNSTKGTYSFWAKPIPAKKIEESRHFSFIIEVSAEGFTPISHVVDIPVVSEANRRLELNSSYSLKIQDLFLFSKEINNPME